MTAASNIPGKIPTPFAQSAAGSLVNTIPSSTGTATGLASWEYGFQQINMTPISAGGIAPFGEDVNGIFQLTSSWDQWFSMGGPVPFDGTFQTTIGGYPKGALLATSTPGTYVTSLIDNNVQATSVGTAWLTCHLIPAIPAPQTAQSAHGVSVGPSYSGSLALTAVAPCAGYFSTQGNINLNGSVGAGGAIEITLINSLTGTLASESTTLPMVISGIVSATAGQSCAVTFQVSSSGTGWTALDASYYLSLAFSPS
jgi:hypothetical protein